MHEVFVAAALVDEAGTLAEDLAICDEYERARHAQFLFERDRSSYAAAHALLRRSLSRHFGGPAPDQWRFERDGYGKPRVHGTVSAAFSLSHARGAVICAVAAPGLDIGVDVERVTARPCPDDVLAKFAPLERARVDACAPAQRDRGFYELWVLKEAYLKACGVGLGVPLDSFWFEHAPDGAIAIGFAEPPRERPPWHFAVRSLGREHIVAVAVAAAAPKLHFVGPFDD